MPIQLLSKNKKRIIKSLRLKKQRELNSLFIIEGKKFVSDIHSCYPKRIESIISFDEELLSQFDFDSLVLSKEEDYHDLSLMQQPTELLAVVKMPDSLKVLSEDVVLVIDRIQDPGNLGTIIRTAVWFGIKEILVIKGSVDVFNPKVVQATASALMNVGFMYSSHEKAVDILSAYHCYMLDMDGKDIGSVDFGQYDKLALIVGNEGQGISDWSLLDDQTIISIPSHFSNRPIDSLNAAISTGIALHTITQMIQK